MQQQMCLFVNTVGFGKNEFISDFPTNLLNPI